MPGAGPVFPKAKTIHVVMDDLDKHREKSLVDAFGPFEGRRPWRRFTVHHTPKHASWLNPAEIEVSLWSRECLGHDRVPSFEDLRARTRAWNARANKSRRRINWQFTTADARRVFGCKRERHGRCGRSWESLANYGEALQIQFERYEEALPLLRDEGHAG